MSTHDDIRELQKRLAAWMADQSQRRDELRDLVQDARELLRASVDGDDSVQRAVDALEEAVDRLSEAV